MEAIIYSLEDPENYNEAQEFYTSVNYLSPIRDEDIVFTARIEDQIIGVVRLAPEVNFLVLRGMMIREDFQRAGIGTELLLMLESHIGPKDCFCLPHDWLDKFYGQIGFETIEDDELPDHLQDRLIENRKKHPHCIGMLRKVYLN